jgi:hypothetical protein
MFTTTELTRTNPISDFYVPTLWPFVVSFRFWYGSSNEDIADFWSSTFSVTEPLTQRIFIIGVVYNNNINYAKKTSLINCLADDQSFYWDTEDQILYIHYNLLHNIDYFSFNFDYGIAIGLTNDTVRYFDNRPFRPFLLEFPQIEIEVDKFNYDKLSFIVDQLIFDNKSGFFNQFKDIPIYGNQVVIKTGEEGDDYNNLIERSVYYIDDYDFSADEFIVDIQDIRKTLTAQIPNIFINDTDYPYASDSSLGKLIPLGYGSLHGVPGILVNETDIDAGTAPQFLLLEIITGSVDSDVDIWMKDNDDVWVPLIPTTDYTVNWSTSIITAVATRILSGSTYSAYPIKADVNGITNTYGSDPIKDLNNRYLSIAYDSDNYDTTTWEAEETFLDPIAFYMDKTLDIYEWYRKLQSASTVGFRYTTTSDNKRVILIDNPNKTSVVNVPSINIKNIDEVIAQSNKDDLYNKIYIGYNRSIIDDTAIQIEDITYFDESFDEYKIIKVLDKISGLITSTPATNKASIQSEDYYKIRKVFECTLIGEEYLDLELYDIIEVELSLQTKKFTVSRILQETLFSEDIIQDTLSLGNPMQEIFDFITITLIGDEYFGTIHGQIISKKPDYDFETNTIKIRQRPYSDVWEGIYGS